MISSRKIQILAALALVFLPLPCSLLHAAEQGSLYADTINYYADTKKVKAEGNVALTSGRSKITGDFGEGTVDTQVFEIKGRVSGIFPEHDAELKSAEAVKWTESAGRNGDGKVEARGNVYLTRGTSDFLKADYVLWEIGTENYSARGSVDSRYDGRILKAAEAKHTADTFSGTKVTRYEDTAQKTVMSAERIDGKMRDGVVQDVVATGDVSVDYTDQEGFKTNLTGAKAVYSKALDTIVVSGGAKAVRSDGKTVSSQTMVLHVETKDIEAIGNAKITFAVDSGKNKDNKNDKKSGASN